MKRSPPRSQPPLHPALRLLLLALMGLALASRLAIGAVAPDDGTHPSPDDALAKLRAATILCGDRAAPPLPRRTPAPPGDLLLLADQADNAHVVTSEPSLPADPGSVSRLCRLRIRPRLALPTPWRGAVQARAPPPQI